MLVSCAEMGVGVGKIIQVMEWWAYVKMLLMFKTDNARCLVYGRGYIYPTAVGGVPSEAFQDSTGAL